MTNITFDGKRTVTASRSGKQVRVRVREDLSGMPPFLRDALVDAYKGVARRRLRERLVVEEMTKKLGFK